MGKWRSKWHDHSPDDSMKEIHVVTTLEWDLAEDAQRKSLALGDLFERRFQEVHEGCELASVAKADLPVCVTVASVKAETVVAAPRVECSLDVSVVGQGGAASAGGAAAGGAAPAAEEAKQQDKKGGADPDPLAGEPTAASLFKSRVVSLGRTSDQPTDVKSAEDEAPHRSRLCQTDLMVGGTGKWTREDAAFEPVDETEHWTSLKDFVSPYYVDTYGDERKNISEDHPFSRAWAEALTQHRDQGRKKQPDKKAAAAAPMMKDWWVATCPDARETFERNAEAIVRKFGPDAVVWGIMPSRGGSFSSLSSSSYGGGGGKRLLVTSDVRDHLVEALRRNAEEAAKKAASTTLHDLSSLTLTATRLRPQIQLDPADQYVFVNVEVTFTCHLLSLREEREMGRGEEEEEEEDQAVEEGGDEAEFEDHKQIMIGGSGSASATASHMSSMKRKKKKSTESSGGAAGDGGCRVS